jgi:hypothetical protein
VKSRKDCFVNGRQNRPACNGKRPVTKVTSHFLIRGGPQTTATGVVLT